MRIRIAVIFMILALLMGVAHAEGYSISRQNAGHFGTLLIDLLHAYEAPSEGDDQRIDDDVTAIAQNSADDGKLAQAIAEHWRQVYLDSSYPMYLYDGSERATTLEQSSLTDSAEHAFVVLGFELEDGKMTDELKGRCEAAAAAARSFPSALLFCSGGATGHNNPKKHTEAGLMKAYLVDKCGIDAGRIFTDEEAMTTLQNAVNTFRMMQAAGIKTFTVVTSSYHQRWGQVIYNAMAEMYRLTGTYDARLVAIYSFDTPAPDRYAHDDRFAARQLTSLLNLPDSVVEDMKKAF